MQVIDLTDDDDDVSNPSSHATPPPEPVATASRTQRLPRYNRQIIDLSTDSSPADAPPRIDPPPNNAPPNDDFTFLMNPHPDFTPAARASPEVEFVFERPLSRNQRPQSPPRDASPQVPEPLAVDLTQDLDDEVVHVRTEGRAGVNLYRPQGAFDVDRMGLGRLAARIWAGRGHGPRRHGAARLQGFAIGGGQQIPDWMRHDDDGPALLVGPPPLMRRPGGGMPDLMNYETVAFELGLPEMPPDFPLVERERQRSPPKYEAPPPVKEPFTRSPVEDESLVCPNCGDELAVGATEEKKQVWIVRSCGHVSSSISFPVSTKLTIRKVYCGECMINRKKQRKSTKGKGRAGEPLLPEPFTSCQAKDHQAMLCGVRVSHVRDVMQIFL